MQKFILALLLIVAAAAAFVQIYTIEIRTVEINALAAGPTGGAVLPIEIKLITPGDGRVYVAGVPEAGQGFGPSGQVALYVASRLSNKTYSNYTALLRVIASDAQVGGPSASGYITVALYALMNNLELRDDTAMTGIILPDGLIGPVGGVQQKVTAAARKGIKNVLVPLGQAPTGVSGVRVIEITSVEDAIYYLTGVRPPTLQYSKIDDRVFKEISLNLFTAVYSLYNRTVRTGYVDTAQIEELKRKDAYYTAASLIYQGLVNYYTQQASARRSLRQSMYEEALKMAREAESQLEKIPLTVNNIDLVVASYTRIYQVYLQANLTSPEVGTMYARALTLRPWVDEAKRMAYGMAVDESGLEEVARLYLDYAKAMYAYLSTTYGISLTDYSNAIQIAEDLYKKGRYIAAIANSIEIIATTAAALMRGAVDRYLEPARERALRNMAYAAACGYPNTLPLSYLQFGDYYSRQNPNNALVYYIMASTYSTAMRDLACRGSGVVYPEFFARGEVDVQNVAIGEEKTSDEKSVWLPILLSLLAALALIYASRQ